MRLLEKVGVEFPHEGALAAFHQHGVKTDGRRVYLAEDQVMKALASAPPRFTIHARNPERSVAIGGGRPAFAPGYGAPFLVDAEVGKRASTLQDYSNLVKIAHALPNQDLSGHLLVEPGDVAAGSAHLHMLNAHMLHSDKPFIAVPQVEGRPAYDGDGRDPVRWGGRPGGNHQPDQQPQPSGLQRRDAGRAAGLCPGAPAAGHCRADDGWFHRTHHAGRVLATQTPSCWPASPSRSSSAPARRLCSAQPRPTST